MDAQPKKRHSVTLNGSYLQALSELVDKGIYHDNGEAIRAGLRLIFEKYKLSPFIPPPDEKTT